MSIFKKITAVFLAGIFLFSSLGFTVSSMVCLKSGKGKVSLFIIEDCCAQKVTPTEICCDEAQEQPPQNITYLKKSDCCDISNYSLQLKDYQVSSKLSVEQPAVIQSLFIIPVAAEAAISEQQIAFQSADLPPPLYGRSLLNYISLLTI